jgi:hypothetical protein
MCNMHCDVLITVLCLSVVTMSLDTTFIFKIFVPLRLSAVLCSLFHIMFHFIPQHGIRADGLKPRPCYLQTLLSQICCVIDSGPVVC